MTATSPGSSLLVRLLVRLSSRTGPLISAGAPRLRRVGSRISGPILAPLADAVSRSTAGPARSGRRYASPGTRRAGQLDQFARMCQCRVSGLQSGHHSGELGGSICIGNLPYPTSAHLAVIGLDHHIVPVRECRNLCQMGNHDDLGMSSQGGQPSADLHRYPAAYTGVDLIEDQGFRIPSGGKDDLQSESNPGQFSAGGDLAETPRLTARVCAEQQIDRIHAVRSELGPSQLEAQLGMRHGKGCQLTYHQSSESLGSLPASRADFGCKVSQLPIQLRNALSQAENPVIAVL